MFTGDINNNIELSVVMQIVQSKDKFREYCKSTVPIEFQHLNEVVENTMFILIQIIKRKFGFDKYRHTLFEEILRDIAVTGYTNEVISISTLLLIVDKKALIEFYKEDKVVKCK